MFGSNIVENNNIEDKSIINYKYHFHFLNDVIAKGIWFVSSAQNKVIGDKQNLVFFRLKNISMNMYGGRTYMK